MQISATYPYPITQSQIYITPICIHDFIYLIIRHIQHRSDVCLWCASEIRLDRMVTDRGERKISYPLIGARGHADDDACDRAWPVDDASVHQARTFPACQGTNRQDAPPASCLALFSCTVFNNDPSTYLESMAELFHKSHHKEKTQTQKGRRGKRRHLPPSLRTNNQVSNRLPATGSTSGRAHRPHVQLHLCNAVCQFRRADFGPFGRAPASTKTVSVVVLSVEQIQLK
jgi:hypothetical protein